jgi:hypothetical protein
MFNLDQQGVAEPEKRVWEGVEMVGSVLSCYKERCRCDTALQVDVLLIRKTVL